MASKLEELRNIVEEQFKNAQTKEQIDSFAKIKEVVEGVEKENKTLEDKAVELLKSYKDIVQHTSFKDAKIEAGVPTSSAPSLDELIDKFSIKK